MDELSTKWQDLSDISQASIVELMAGKHQGNVFSSLMENFDIARQVIEASTDATGSALNEHSKYMDSMEGKLQQLSAAWQSFSQTFMNSEFSKGVIDLLRTLLDLLDKLVGTFGTLGTISLFTFGGGLIKYLKNLKSLKSANNIADVADAVTDVTSAMTDGIQVGVEYAYAIDDVVGATTDVVSGGSKVVDAMGNVVKSTGKATTGFKAFFGTLAGKLTIFGAVAAGILLIYNAYKKSKEAAAEARRETIETSNAFLDSATSFEQAYIKYSGRTNLTASEESELESAINGTVDALGDKSSALQDVVNGSNDYVASLEAIKNAELDAAVAVATKKRDNAELELEEAAMGWARWDGSEVNISIDADSKDYDVAKSLDSKYFYSKTQRVNDLGSTATVAGFELSKDASTKEIIDYYNSLVDYQKKLKETLSDDELVDSSAYKEVSAAIERMSEAIDTYIEGVYEAAKAQYQLNNGIPKTTEDYIQMREAILSNEDLKGLPIDTLKSIANALDADYSQIFDLSSVEFQARKLVGILDEYGDAEVGQMETFLNMRTAVNNNECTVGEYMSQLDNINNMMDGWSDEAKEELKLSFGLDTDSVKQQYEELEKYLLRNVKTTGRLTPRQQETYKAAKKDIQEFLDSLTASELSAFVSIKTEIDWKNTRKKEILAQIQKEAEFQEAMNYTISVGVETENLNALNSALSESVSATGLSSESIESLKSRYAELASQGYDLSAMFEETSNGIHLNKAAVSELEQAYASSKLTETDEQLGILKDRYDELTDKIKNCTDAEERAALYTEQQTIVAKINDLATLAAQYEGLASAYNAWQNAESAGNERDMYESIISGFETVEDEIARGWYDDGTIKFLELITGKTDLAGKSASELKEIWNSLDDTIKGTSYSVKDFFTTDEDGNSTSTGAYNFLRAVEELGKNGGLKAIKDEAGNLMDIGKLVERNADDKIVAFDFSVVGGDKAVADALGISEEMVQIIQRALDDAGFVVTLDGKYTLLSDLKNSAETANDTLKKLKSEGLSSLKNVDLDFNFDASNLEDLNTELEKAITVLDKFKDKNGQLKKDSNGNLVEGAQEALDIAMYYQATLDKLTEPAYMQIETNQVEEDLREPLQKMQDFEDLVKQKHLLVLEGDTEGLKDVEAQMEDIVDYIDKNDDLKVKLGIEDMSKDEIKQALEKGEIEIPATVDIQLEMSDDIKDMRLLMMNQIGLVSDAEVKLKIGYEIDDSLVNSLTEDEKEIVVKVIAENEDWFNKLSGEEKEVIVDLVASGVDVDRLLDDEKKEVIIDFVTENEDWFDELSNEDKKVVIDLVLKNEDEFNSLTEEEKEVVVDLVSDDSALEALENHEVTIEAFAEVFGVEKVDDLKKKLDGLTDKQIEALAKVIGKIDVEKLQQSVSQLDDKTIQAIAEALGKGDVDGLKTAIQNIPDKKVAQAIAEAFGYEDVDSLCGAIGGLDSKTVQAVAQALGIKDVKSLKTAVNRLSNKTVKAIAKVNGLKDVKNLQSALSKLKGKTITVWATIKKKASSLWESLTGGGGVDGTAHANGTAYANGTTNNHTIKKSGKAYKQGDWGAKDSGIALGAEEGPELLVRNGKWHLIGEDGAEFFGYRRGDIIFNANQTRELFEKGKITHGNGRGKALVSGTAFYLGTGGGEEATVNSNSVTGKTYGSSSSSSDDADEFEETLDWIQTAIERIEREIDRLDTKTNSVYRSWSERNSNLVDEISTVREEIELQERAYQKYIEAANAVGLSSEYVNKIKNGTIDIETITDETLKEKIEDFKEYYEAAFACQDAILELKEKESELYKQRFDNVATQYEGMLSIIEHEKNMLDEYITQSEAQGWLISEKYYDALISNEKSTISKLQQEKSALLSELQTAMESGTIAKNSEAYYEMIAAIDEVTLSIEQSNTAIKEYQQSIQQLKWEQFDLLQDKISAITDEADFLIELLSSDKLYDDSGKLTDEGIATMGLLGVNYNTLMRQADMVADEIERVKKEMESDPYDTELEEHYRELIALQQEYILGAQQEKEAIRDLISDGIEAELDSLSELIDKYMDVLDSQQDVYEYQKKISSITDEISSLEKQYAAYSNDTSEEGQKKLQQISVDLEDARQELEETETDRLIESTEKLLTSLYDEYELILNQRLDNLDALIESTIAQINADATAISTTLTETAESVGYTLSSEMSSIWDVNSAKINDVITMYGQNFANAQTTTNTVLTNIKTDLATMISQLNSIANANAKSASTSSAANSSQANATTKTSSSSSASNKSESTSSGSTAKEITVGGKINAGNATIYETSSGTGGGRQYYRDDPIYTVLSEKNGYILTRWHKLSSGYTGWFKKSDVQAYATGAKKIDDDDVAWTQEAGQEFIVRPSDGAILTPVAKGDSVLTAQASKNIWNMANSPAEFIKDNLNLSNNVPVNSSSQNSFVQNLDKVVFNLPNVRNYEELLAQMQKDKSFEKLITAMTVDKLAGGSSLAKGKAIR